MRWNTRRSGASRPDALELQGGPTAGPDVVLRFPYRDIVGVRLSYAPSRFDSARYRCDLRMRSGQRLAILSTHYAGIADFEDRAATYGPFVRALIARVAAANPSASYRSGKSPVTYWAEHLFLLAMVVLLVLVLSMAGFAYVSDSSWVKLAIVLVLHPAPDRVHAQELAAPVQAGRDPEGRTPVLIPIRRRASLGKLAADRTPVPNCKV